MHFVIKFYKLIIKENVYIRAQILAGREIYKEHLCTTYSYNAADNIALVRWVLPRQGLEPLRHVEAS